jgi:hypothetical protein
MPQPIVVEIVIRNILDGSFLLGHGFLFFLDRYTFASRGCVRSAQVTAALPPSPTLCVLYFANGDITSP